MTGSKKSVNNKQKTKSAKKSLITIELVVFAFLAIYIAGYGISSLKKPKINLEVVSYGSIDKPQVYDGAIIRSEQVTYAQEDGKAYFNYNDSEYVKKGSVICVIRDNKYSDTLEKEITSMSENILKQQEFRSYSPDNENEIKRIESKMKAASDNAIPMFFTYSMKELYSYKFQIQREMELRNSIITAETNPAATSLSDQKKAFEKQLESSTARYRAEFGGVLSYGVDGLEQTFTEENLFNLSPEQIAEEGSGPESLYGDKEIKKDEAIFKIIDSNTWYVCAYLDPSDVYGWDVGNTKDLYLQEGDISRKISMKVEEIISKGSSRYVVFSSSKYLTDFIHKRNIKFSLNDSSFKGLKIPNTAITQKTTLKIPNDFVYEFRGSSGIYVKEGNGYSFKSIDILSKSSEYCNVLQDFKSIKLGTVAYKYSPESLKVIENESYTITELQTTAGIYVANSGTAEFKQINVLTGNEYFSVIEKGVSYGVKPFDRIVSDAGTVTDNQIIR